MIVITSAFLLAGNQFKRDIRYYPKILAVCNFENIQLAIVCVSIYHLYVTNGKQSCSQSWLVLLLVMES